MKRGILNRQRLKQKIGKKIFGLLGGKLFCVFWTQWILGRLIFRTDFLGSKYMDTVEKKIAVTIEFKEGFWEFNDFFSENV